ncbi:MAG: hypothetical protein BWY73_00668 [candidate division TA06 bacterium ADurb.Bin417]|uniref:Uncharacterized protein n=1 Tax=candidate division TA06 bacterium ADurb.Bin417 TaxID=1852828 RepID=A0A1V5MHU8_UNCT6|nr:MAG: hypothetical protein BWY73_00668 [candidate division TA06 bacterium ADurb.Bin417]
MVYRDAAPGDQQIFNPLGDEAAIGNGVTGAGRQTQVLSGAVLGVVDVDGISAPGYAVREIAPFQNVFPVQDVIAQDPARFARTGLAGGISQVGLFETGQVVAVEFHQRPGLAPSFDFRPGQVLDIGSIAGHAGGIGIEFPAAGHREESAGLALDRVGAVLVGALHDRVQFRVFLGPVVAQVLGNIGDHEGQGERLKQLFVSGPAFFVRGAGRGRNISVAGGVDYRFGQYRLPAGLALQDDPPELVPFFDDIDRQGVQAEFHAGFEGHLLDQVLAGLRFLADVRFLDRVGGGAAHFFQPAGEFQRNPLDDEAAGLVVVGADVDDASGGKVAAQAGVAFDQHGSGAAAGRGDGGRKSGRAAADHQHVGFGGHRQAPPGFHYVAGRWFSGRAEGNFGPFGRSVGRHPRMRFEGAQQKGAGQRDR